MTASTTPPPSDRTRVRLKPDRGRDDRATIDAILMLPWWAMSAMSSTGSRS